MVTFRHSATSPQDRMLCATRLLLFAAAFVIAAAIPAGAQARRTHVSDDLKRHLDSGDATATAVIVVGSSAQVDAIAARHGLSVRRRLSSGAVLDVPAGRLAEVADDNDIPQLSGDHITRGQMAVTDVSIGADQAWSGDFGPMRTGVTGQGIGIAVLDSGVTMVPGLVGQVTAHVDMIDARGFGRDEWGHGTHIAGIIAAAGSLARNETRGVAPGASIVSVKVLGADGSGHVSDLLEGIDWVIANRQRYQIKVINLSLGAAVEQSWHKDPVCQAIERAWRVNVVTVAAAGNLGKTAEGKEILGGVTSPGNCPYAITAGAVNTKGTAFRSDDVIATYSSRGLTRFDHLIKPDLLAPGNRIRSLLAPGTVIAKEHPELVTGAGRDATLELSGTSMSSAVVAGAAALLLEARPKAKAEAIRALLQLGSERLPGLGLIQEGAGSLNVLASLSGPQGEDAGTTSIVGERILTGRLSFAETSVGGDHIIWGD